MANLDTALKRRSAMHVGPPFMRMLPAATGTIDQASRQSATWQYAGILAGLPLEDDAPAAYTQLVGGGGYLGGMWSHVRVGFMDVLDSGRRMINDWRTSPQRV